uniref:CUE domain-containing protein n=1 Tax=Chromera velia CCMP2878 TaxID=1169474 RepID=A0A0G4GX00_9ALVE|eukprot:Cvel_23755.t1-p1 / transcript=Cvel_23755.t1 / gene=Cvel_23755 / organism=Chromera_velia_CCMP2878 / gene_product=hypothetical protein / transcript_product=hypothetical protein / location=Cvel_scaffold2488:16930-23992(+) / protein_length=995 / sequence_SO=supercontig / SO=protein_coding / is_pseudo=false
MHQIVLNELFAKFPTVDESLVHEIFVEQCNCDTNRAIAYLEELSKGDAGGDGTGGAGGPSAAGPMSGQGRRKGRKGKSRPTTPSTPAEPVPRESEVQDEKKAAAAAERRKERRLRAVFFLQKLLPLERTWDLIDWYEANGSSLSFCIQCLIDEGRIDANDDRLLSLPREALEASPSNQETEKRDTQEEPEGGLPHSEPSPCPPSAPPLPPPDAHPSPCPPPTQGFGFPPEEEEGLDVEEGLSRVSLEEGSAAMGHTGLEGDREREEAREKEDEEEAEDDYATELIARIEASHASASVLGEGVSRGCSLVSAPASDVMDDFMFPFPGGESELNLNFAVEELRQALAKMKPDWPWDFFFAEADLPNEKEGEGDGESNLFKSVVSVEGLETRLQWCYWEGVAVEDCAEHIIKELDGAMKKEEQERSSLPSSGSKGMLADESDVSPPPTPTKPPDCIDGKGGDGGFGGVKISKKERQALNKLAKKGASGMHLVVPPSKFGSSASSSGSVSVCGPKAPETVLGRLAAGPLSPPPLAGSWKGNVGAPSAGPTSLSPMPQTLGDKWKMERLTAAWPSVPREALDQILEASEGNEEEARRVLKEVYPGHERTSPNAGRMVHMKASGVSSSDRERGRGRVLLGLADVENEERRAQKEEEERRGMGQELARRAQGGGAEAIWNSRFVGEDRQRVPFQRTPQSLLPARNMDSVRSAETGVGGEIDRLQTFFQNASALQRSLVLRSVEAFEAGDAIQASLLQQQAEEAGKRAARAKDRLFAVSNRGRLPGGSMWRRGSGSGGGGSNVVDTGEVGDLLLIDLHGFTAAGAVSCLKQRVETVRRRVESLRARPGGSAAPAQGRAEGFLDFSNPSTPVVLHVVTQEERLPFRREASLVASSWVPDPSLSPSSSVLPEPVVWAALDCPGFFSIGASEDRAFLLGQMKARVVREVSVGQRCVVIGWFSGMSGRKYFTNTALFDQGGGLLAQSEQIWIELKQKVPKKTISAAL